MLDLTGLDNARVNLTHDAEAIKKGYPLSIDGLRDTLFEITKLLPETQAARLARAVLDNHFPYTILIQGNLVAASLVILEVIWELDQILNAAELEV